MGNLYIQTNVPFVSLFSYSSRSERGPVLSQNTVSEVDYHKLEETDKGRVLGDGNTSLTDILSASGKEGRTMP